MIFVGVFADIRQGCSRWTAALIICYSLSYAGIRVFFGVLLPKPPFISCLPIARSV